MDGGHPGEAPKSAGVSSAVFIVPMLFPKPMCPLKADQKAEAPPGNHVPDAERNTGYISNISQLSDSVNHNASPNDMERNKEKTMEQEPIQPALSPLVTLGLKFHRLKRTRKIQSIMLSLTKTPYITPATICRKVLLK